MYLDSATNARLLDGVFALVDRLLLQPIAAIAPPAQAAAGRLLLVIHGMPWITLALGEL